METANILLQNQFGGRAIACARHVEECAKSLLGQLVRGVTSDPCPTCQQEAAHAAESAKMRNALLHPNFSHTRAKGWCRAMIVHCYHRDDASPIGVLLAASLDEERFLEVELALKHEGRWPSWASPLSPTEAR